MLNDVWYNLSDRVLFLTRNTFDQAPPSPAVYAWYYPLRISTYDLSEFLNEVMLVMTYDASCQNTISMSATLRTAWRKFGLELLALPKVEPIPNSFQETWDAACENRFDTLRQDLMRLSLFMPPLYIGKTNSLARRIREHIDGQLPGKGFHDRFERFAKENHLSQGTVADLLCVAITSPTEDSSDDYVKLVEYIMKALAGPGFSMV